MANFQGKEELSGHHFGKNIMNKPEDDIKPLNLSTAEINKMDLENVLSRYNRMLKSGDLDRRQYQLAEKKKRPGGHGPRPKLSYY